MVEGLPPIPCVCAICKSHEAEIKETAPLCSGCRDQLTKLAVPLWLKIAAVCVGVVVLYTAVRLPWVLGASIAWDKGQAALDAHDYPKAEMFYEQTLKYYPDDPSIWGQLARAAEEGGDKDKFNKAMDQLAALSKTDPEAAHEMAEVLMRERPAKP